MTYCEAIEEMFSMYEDVCLEYELDTLTEAAGTNDSSKGDKFKSFLKTIFKYLIKIWNTIRTFITKLLLKVKTIGVSKTMFLTSDVKVCKMASEYDTGMFSKIRSMMSFASIVNLNDTEIKTIENEIVAASEKVTLKKDSKVEFKKLTVFLDMGSKCTEAVDKILNENLKKLDSDKELDIDAYTEKRSYLSNTLSKMSNLVYTAVEDARKILLASTTVEPKTTDKKVVEESAVSDIDKLRAHLLIEAADLLGESIKEFE